LTLKAFMHSLITMLDPVLNSFMRHRVRTKSRECFSLALTGQASKPYKITGRPTHFIITNLITTSSEAMRPTLPKTELKERKYDFLAFLKQHLKCLADCKYIPK
jgi:hypothetical protein